MVRSGVTLSIRTGIRKTPTPSNAWLLMAIRMGEEMYFPLGITASRFSIV